MEVCNIENLKNKIPEDEFEEICEGIKERLESRIEFSPEDFHKELEQIEKEREEKLERLMSKLKIHVDVNYFQKRVNILIKEIGYSTSASIKPIEPKLSKQNLNPVNNEIENKLHDEE